MAGLGAFAVLAAAISTATVLLADADPAGAAELERFASCAEVQRWVEDVQAPAHVARDGGDVPTMAAEESRAAAPATTTADAEGAGGADLDAGTGGTNTVVEGVDEIDVVERLDGDRALVARNDSLWLVDLADLEVLDAVRGLPFDARMTVGGDVVWVTGSESGSDGSSGTVVHRLRLDGDSLVEGPTWRTRGWLVDARRTGDRLHVVAVDQPFVAGAIPFEDGPVPCDQIWHPSTGADTPAATLLATLPAEGELAPTATAEVVGSGAGFHVTNDAAYVTTQRWEDEVTTDVHRFDLATLTPSGSGSVPGMLPGPFAISEHDGHLRVATNAQPSGGIAIDAAPAQEPAVDVARPPVGTGDPLAEVFVLDLEGTLDVVGRTGRFGHAGESVHGVRFVEDVAYVVTFLQTDPFWILDLADPTSPRTVGELEIPGFSGYLHPLTDTRVVGFGPDGEGSVAARLFDVADPARPALLDELRLGTETPVAWDHHAYVRLDDARFAVPVSDPPTYVGERCDDPVPLPTPVPEPRPLPVEPDGGIGDTGTSSSSPGIVAPCRPILEGGEAGVVVLELRDGRLVEADAQRVPNTDGSLVVDRVLPVGDDGWVLVATDRLIDPEGGELALR